MLNLNIRTKLITIMLLVGLVPVLIVGFVSLQTSKRELQKEHYNHLETTTQSRAHHVETLVNERKRMTKMISSSFVFVNLLKLEESSSDYNAQKQTVTNRFKSIVEINEEIIHIHLVNKSGITITSTNPISIGEDRSELSLFKKANQNETVTGQVKFPPEGGNPVLSFASPVKSGDEIVGFIFVRTSIELLNKITIDKTGIGETGETYLINKEGYMITPSRFKEDVVLKQKVDTKQANLCIDEHVKETLPAEMEEKTLTYADYRDMEVMGVHQYIPGMNWCLLTEIDEAETMGWISEAIFKIFFTTGLFAIFILIVAWIISGKISKPILKLQKDVKIIEKGDLDHKIGYKGGGEIGQLARAFDKMTVAIKESRADVDRKVEEQTKEITNEKEKIQTIIQGIGDAVFVVDKNRKLTVFNKKAEELSGFSIDEAMGKPYNKILNFAFEKDGKVNNKFVDDVFSTGRVQEMANHTMLIKKDGSKISVADSAAPLKDSKGDIFGCVVVFRDMSREREIDKMKSEFISVASHQLKTPLTGIKWLSGSLMKGKIGKITKKQQEYLSDIHKSNEKMIRLVNDLLDVSHIETGRKFDIIKKETDIVKIVDQALLDNQQLITKNKIKIIKCKGAPKKLLLNVDGEKITQAYDNLINNAVKYSAIGGQIEIGCEHKEKSIVFTVRDHGIGIPENQQDKIFSKFFRADNASGQETDGTGLGLYIAKSIIEAHGGKIWFESQEKVGTTFYFELPVK